MRIGHDLGPDPTPAAPSNLSATRRRVLGLVAAAQPAGTTVAQVADEIGGHPNGARAHLDGLVADGLVFAGTAESSGRGRPARIYTIAPGGQRVLAAGGNDSYRSLSHAFARYIAASQDAEQAHQIGLTWAETLADDPDAETGDLFGLLTALGFSPIAESPGADDNQDEIVALHSCPLLAEARENPRVVCAIHEGLIAGSLSHWGRAADVHLEPFSGPGVCSLRVRPIESL